MPYQLRVLPESRTGLVTGSGHVTGTELIQACGDLIGHADWRPGFDEVWDLTGAREIDIGPDELTDMVASTHKHAEQIGSSRCVFVQTRDGVEAVLRLFELLTADLTRTYHTARTRQEAAEWLGLAPGSLSDPTTGNLVS